LLKFAIRLEQGESPVEARRNAYNDLFDGDVELEQGDSPVKARHNACNDVFDGDDADVDDKTLQRWLKRAFGLAALPRSAAAWKKITRPLVDLINSRKGQIPKS
jgi:hypothetical protein